MEVTEKNLLPYDGVVHYYGRIFTPDESNYYFEKLLHKIEWRNDEAIMFGKRIITKRKVAWYADQPFEYTYSKITKSALSWTKELIDLKKITERSTGETFNSCLLNLYHSGEEGMAWHSDDEKDLKSHAAIGSLSFGARRKFSFKHKKTKERVDIALDPGSLLVMTGATQLNWWHRLPPSKLVTQPRINLTFRMML
ncbi:MAG: alpha-ketoglutarate-dependent dioxygenase AlkB [Bacteroidota bacterium]